MVPSTRKVIVASTALAALVWFAVPAEAQRGQRGQGSQGSRTAPQGASRSSGQAQAQPRSGPPPQQSAPAPPRTYQAQRPAPSPTYTPPAQNRGPSPLTPPSRNAGPALQQSQPQARGPIGPRVPPPFANVGPRPQATPRQGPPASNTYRAAPNYGYSQQRGTPYGGSNYGSYNYGRQSRATVVVRRPVFVQPYFSFRPRFSLGFGLFVGYSVAYPFQYYDPYGFYNYRIGMSPAYGYGTSYRSYSSGYDQYYNQMGGLSFDIDPIDAAVFIDGTYVGTAEDFSSGQMPLTMLAGRHHVELRAQGFMTVSFDIAVIAGQVIPYQGTMPIIR